MSATIKTRDRILGISKMLFNELGYSGTSMAEIARQAGMSKGNLTYHFSTKYDLVLASAQEAREQRRVNTTRAVSGTVFQQYIQIVFESMEQSREFRFLNRDRAQFQKSRVRRSDDESQTELETLASLLETMKKENMFLPEQSSELSTLARSCWMVSYFWISHVQQIEGISEITWTVQKRGMRQHFSILLSRMTPAAQDNFENTLIQITPDLKKQFEQRNKIGAPPMLAPHKQLKKTNTEVA